MRRRLSTCSFLVRGDRLCSTRLWISLISMRALRFMGLTVTLLVLCNAVAISELGGLSMSLVSVITCGSYRVRRRIGRGTLRCFRWLLQVTIFVLGLCLVMLFLTHLWGLGLRVLLMPGWGVCLLVLRLCLSFLVLLKVGFVLLLLSVWRRREVW